jgi:hypothetical protein
MSFWGRLRSTNPSCRPRLLHPGPSLLAHIHPSAWKVHSQKVV